ncbi:hypothetical protein SAY87_013911 [Trapa incisa]|uniref:S-acyltransferase n=1 Tax=Trapa incisa TaxID=236973 RepID=A0AAN7K9E0_9MYRT|nr:hypothetical protein SAY87_013911 [Trapa incisa]
MFSGDPGVVSNEAPEASRLAECQNESFSLAGRVRFCQSCKAYIKGFDHHCPAFGNCIGQNNHFLFMALLVGLLLTEGSFVACSYKFLSISPELAQTATDNSVDLANGAMLFSLLQLLWQTIFFTWHVYCVLFNIKTEEWVNWEKYPEFQVHIADVQENKRPKVRFRNPYSNGIIQNVKDFFAHKR